VLNVYYLVFGLECVGFRFRFVGSSFRIEVNEFLIQDLWNRVQV